MKEILLRLFRGWKGDYAFKTFLNSSGSALLCALFALYNGYLGAAHASVWNGSISFYYLMLALIRVGIVQTGRRNQTRTPENAQKMCERTYFLSCAGMAVLALGLIYPIRMMVLQQRPVTMGLIPAIAVAAYTTCKVVFAAIHLRKKNKSPDLLVYLLRSVNFIDALVSVMTLQNTLIAVNGGGDSMRTLSAITSSAFLLVILALIGISILHGIKERKEKE